MIFNVYIFGFTDESVTFPAFPLVNLLPTDKAKYYRYNGSLTTPTCDEAVTWTVFNDPVEISQAQVKFFSGVTCSHPLNFLIIYYYLKLMLHYFKGIRPHKENYPCNVP